jgi:hypothetical protein
VLFTALAWSATDRAATDCGEVPGVSVKPTGEALTQADSPERVTFTGLEKPFSAVIAIEIACVELGVAVTEAGAEI